jgi:hypothetical protein
VGKAAHIVGGKPALTAQAFERTAAHLNFPSIPLTILSVPLRVPPVVPILPSLLLLEIIALRFYTRKPPC